MNEIFLETDRLFFRKITPHDYNELAIMLQDLEVMYAWEYAFSDKEIKEWIDKNINLYKKYNLGYFLVIHKTTKEILGQAALIPLEKEKYYEIGYIFKKQYWKNGYARESAKALAQYAFEYLNLDEVIFIIKTNNTSSKKVAKSLGAKITGELTKNVKGKEMPHLIYTLKVLF